MINFFIDFGGWLIRLPFLGLVPRESRERGPTFATAPRRPSTRQREQGRELDPVSIPHPSSGEHEIVM